MAQRSRPLRMPWKDGPWGLFKKFMLSKGVQTALQLSTGTFFVSLFVLVNPMRFNRSCLSTIFFLAAELVVAQDQHVGSHLFAGCVMLGQLTLGIVWAGLMVMLAHAPHVAYTTFLVIFGCLGFLPVAAIRAKIGPPALPINLGYSITILNAQFGWGAGFLWSEILGPLLYLPLVVAAGSFMAGLLMLSTLASDELRDVLSDTLTQVGECVSGYASHMLVPPALAKAAAKGAHSADTNADEVNGSDGSDKAPAYKVPGATTAAEFQAKSMRPLGPAVSLQPVMATFMETPGIKEFHEQLWAATDPSRPHGPAKLTGHGRASVTALLPNIQLARRLIVEANAEPPFLGRHRIQIQYWGGAIAALETLILRAGSLEAVLTTPDPLLDGNALHDLLGVDVLPTLRVLYAEVAACCSSMASAMKYRRGLQNMYRFGRLFDVAWPALQHHLRAALREGLTSCTWTRWELWTSDTTDVLSSQMRALMYVATLTSEIMTAVAAVEAAWEEAAAHQTTAWPFPHISMHASRYEQDPEAKAALEASAQHTVKAALQGASSRHRVRKGPAADDSATTDGFQNGHNGSSGAIGQPAAEEADMLEAGQLPGGTGGDTGRVSAQPTPGAQQTPPHIVAAAAEDPSVRSTSSEAAPASPRSPHSPASEGSRRRPSVLSSRRSLQIPRILREFQDATNTSEDAPRPAEKPPKPVEQLKSDRQQHSLPLRKLSLHQHATHLG